MGTPLVGSEEPVTEKSLALAHLPTQAQKGTGH